MPKFIDLTGQRFGRFLVLAYAGPNKQGAATWWCKCDCGKEKVVTGSELRRGSTQSCGCYHSEVQRVYATKYGYGLSRIAYIWRSMISRCNNPRNKSYKNYGGRGIKVCEEWVSDIEKFRSWALDNGYSDELTIDRIDVNGDYCPENCRWATMKVQQNNRRNNNNVSFNGEIHSLAVWEEITGICRRTISRRLQSGWSIERALTEPTKGR